MTTISHFTGFLTDREVQVLELVCDGFSDLAISERLGITVKTTQNHIYSMKDKAGLHQDHELKDGKYNEFNQRVLLVLLAMGRE